MHIFHFSLSNFDNCSITYSYISLHLIRRQDVIFESWKLWKILFCKYSQIKNQVVKVNDYKLQRIISLPAFCWFASFKTSKNAIVRGLSQNLMEVASCGCLFRTSSSNYQQKLKILECCEKSNKCCLSLNASNVCVYNERIAKPALIIQSWNSGNSKIIANQFWFQNVIQYVTEIY